jgi:hypothetical protein
MSTEERDVFDVVRYTLYVVSFLKGTERLGNWIRFCPHTKSGDNCQVGCDRRKCAPFLHNPWIAVWQRETEKKYTIKVKVTPMKT